MCALVYLAPWPMFPKACSFSNVGRKLRLSLRSVANLTLGLLLVVGPVRGLTTQGEKNFGPLQPGTKTEQAIAGGRVHTYEVILASNQYMSLVVNQRGVDVVVTLFDSGLMKLIERDSPNGREGPEQISFIADQAGEYRIEVRASQEEPTGRYEITIEELRTATTQDRSRLSADRAFQEAERLRAIRKADSFRQAIAKYEESIRLYRTLEDRANEARALFFSGALYHQLADYPRAAEYFTQAQSIYQAIGDRFQEVKTITNLAAVQYAMSNYRGSVELSTRAAQLYKAIGEPLGEGIALNSIGAVYLNTGDPLSALDYLNKALTTVAGHREFEATTLHNIGGAHNLMGEYQKALERLNQAQTLFRLLRDPAGEARTVSLIGDVYDSLGDYDSAMSSYKESLTLRQGLGDRRGEALSLTNIGVIHSKQGELTEALELYHRALAIRRAINDRAGQANTLLHIGTAYSASDQPQKALEVLNEALSLAQTIGERRLEATTLHNMGSAHHRLRRPTIGLKYHEQSLEVSREVRHRRLEAESLYAIAGIQRQAGNLIEARSKIEEAIPIIESLRSNAPGPEQRSTLMASTQRCYELKIDVLMQLQNKNPAEGLDVSAFETAEMARARSLLEMLTEARVDIRSGVDPTLVERERSLQQLLNAKAEHQSELLSRRHSEAQAREASGEIQRILKEYRQVQAQIRTASPGYAALTQPEPLTLKQIQEQLLDPDTTLLEYSLGAARSYLWAVTTDSVSAFVLPTRQEIEASVRRFLEHLKSETNAAALSEEGSRLSEILLGPVATKLKGSKLAIVGDGALQYLPFAALPEPGANRGEIAEPLIAGHEIVSLPSASVLAVLRRETSGRPIAPKTIVVLADPVFTPDDPRVRRMAGRPPAQDNQEQLSKALRDGDFRLSRLISTRQEAKTLLSLAPASDSRQAMDFQANREMAMGHELGQFRMVHFATHGFVNTQHPELSGIVLSLVNEKGQSRDGFLRLHDVYRLKLPVELVVLSACQTGLGKDIRGEGLIGLTRGFMYAGAKRVVASMWKVDDRATAELMKLFYSGMLGEKKLAPAAALRQAQISISKRKHWQHPKYWAAFVLQGEWR